MDLFDKMFDEDAKPLAFICQTCEHWGVGKDAGRKNVEGHSLCSMHAICKSPIGGGSFDAYKGPLEGSGLVNYCYVCGGKAEHALEPEVPNARRIGICKGCLPKVQEMATRDPGRKIVFTSEAKVGPGKFEVAQ